MAVEERQIQVRRDTASNWGSVNPILAVGEPGYDSTNGIFKVGDGSTAWNSLPTVSEDEISEHESAVNPHDQYATDVRVDELEADDVGAAPTPHTIGGSHHSSDTLANLNAKISNATLDDSGSPRTPTSHGNEAHGPEFITADDVPGAKNSVEIDADDVQLVGDAASPGNNKVYGTDGSGTRGWKDDPEGGSGGTNAAYQFFIRQTSAGGSIDARPSTGDQPNGTVNWLLFDAPGTNDGPSDVEPLDLVFNISGTEW